MIFYTYKFFFILFLYGVEFSLFLFWAIYLTPGLNLIDDLLPTKTNFTGVTKQNNVQISRVKAFCSIQEQPSLKNKKKVPEGWPYYQLCSTLSNFLQLFPTFLSFENFTHLFPFFLNFSQIFQNFATFSQSFQTCPKFLTFSQLSLTFPIFYQFSKFYKFFQLRVLE